MMKLLPGIQNSASALQAERIRQEVIAQNIANAYVTKGEGGKPYQRQVVKFETLLQERIGNDSESVPQLLKPAKIVKDSRPFQSILWPGHPDADKQGYVIFPNVNIHEEMADMIVSTRTYEANLAVIKNARALTYQTLSIGRR